MRLIVLATIIVVGFCLAYSHYAYMAREEDRSSYSGPATFVSLTNDAPDHAPRHWLLVCRVGSDRIIFTASDDLSRQAANLRPGQPVYLHYDLPVSPTAGGVDYAPPTLRDLAPIDGAGPSFALDVP